MRSASYAHGHCHSERAGAASDSSQTLGPAVYANRLRSEAGIQLQRTQLVLEVADV